MASTKLLHDRIYRKTALGQTTLGTRSSALPARARTALILVNGRDSLAMLMGKVGADAVALVELLLGLGLVEEVLPSVEPPRPTPAPAAAPTPTAGPAAPPLPPQPVDAGLQARLTALKRQALHLLAPQFGPDVDVVCAALLAARSEAAYGEALSGIETKLAIYLGRKPAQRLVDGLRL